mgnify:FL=1
MKQLYTKLTALVVLMLFSATAHAQFHKKASPMEERYGNIYVELQEKFSGLPEELKIALDEERSRASVNAQAILSQNLAKTGNIASPYVGKTEEEPNNFFDESNNIDDVLALSGVLNDEYTGRLVSGEFSSATDIDVYEFTVDTTMMYYFAGLHGFDADGEEIDVDMRLFHESDLDTAVVENFLGVDGNDQIKGDILGRDTDGRGGAGLFRLTGWSSPVDQATGDKLTGKFYLWVFNSDGDVGTYNMTAYAIPFADFVDRKEPDYPYSALVQNVADPNYYLPTDGVVRTNMLYQPDTVKVVTPAIPSQSNGVYSQLLAEGDEDIDLYFLNYKKDHNIVIETLPYFGFYRDNDGNKKAGSSRLSDPRVRLYTGDFTIKLDEDDDGADEEQDGPNNIHSEIKMSPAEIVEAGGNNEDGLLIFWMGAWASQVRDPGRNVDNRDPGRMMYDIFAYQYMDVAREIEPNNSVETAQMIVPYADSTFTGELTAGDEDHYRIFAFETNSYTLFSTGSVDAEVKVEIFHEYEDAFGSTAVSTDLVVDSSYTVVRDGNNFMIKNLEFPASGAYIVKLSSEGTGAYEFGFVDKGEVWDNLVLNEPDNTLEAALAQDAIAVGPGAPAKTGMIAPVGDIDHYYFTADEEFTLTVKGKHAELVDDANVKLTLLTDDLTEISTSTYGSITHTPSSSATFVVRVEAVDAGDKPVYILSGGEPFEEVEPNDSFATATGVAIEQLYDAELTAGDVDFFKFDLKAGVNYSFRSVDQATGGDLTVEFFDEIDGTTLMDESGWYDNYSGDNFKIANIMPSEDKTYYLKVSSESGTGSYKILSRQNTDFETLKTKHEPDNTIEQAAALPAALVDGQDRMYVQYNADHPRLFGDLDHFKLELVEGQKITVTTKPVAGSTAASSDPNLWNRDTDTKLYILDASGTELDDDDDGGNSWYSELSFTAPSTGTYYVQVANSRGEGSGDDRSMRRGDYILNIATGLTETEDNSTVETANVLPAEASISATLTDASDVDMFKISMEADRIYHFRTSQPEDDEIEIEVEFYAASDLTTNLYADGSSFNTRYGDDNVKMNFIPEAAGDYYIKLQASADNAALDVGNNAYTLYTKSNDITALKDAGESNDSIEEAKEQPYTTTDGVFRDYMLYDADVDGFHDDRDYYRVYAEAGDVIVGETAPFNGNFWKRDFDAYMYLFDADGNELETNDDGGFDWHSKITYTVETTGDYFFLVIGQDAHSAPRNDDSNRLRDPSRGEYKFAATRTVDGVVTSNEEEEQFVNEYSLDQNYPNPFNPTTTIRYSLAQASDVQLEVYNILGQRVSTLVNTRQSAGVYTVDFDASRLATGMYIYRIQAGSFVKSGTMMLIK